MQVMPRAGAAVALVAAACLAAAVPARAQNAAAAPEPASQPYRLGTAASPFGWSTAVGDLNADGRPDYAIADRVGRAGAGFAYAVELSIAGIGSQSVTFDAPDAALTVSLRDVDHDRDLDVVISALFSRAVVGVWLNDGAGKFHAATSWPPATERPGDPQADVGVALAADGAAFVPRRTTTGVALDLARAYVGAVAHLRPAHDTNPFAPASRARIRPRAPPRV